MLKNLQFPCLLCSADNFPFLAFICQGGDYIKVEAHEIAVHKKRKLKLKIERDPSMKNPAYGRHQLSRPMRIVGPIQI